VRSCFCLPMSLPPPSRTVIHNVSVARGHAPVLGLCRALLAAGYDPRRPLHAYRGDTVALENRDRQCRELFGGERHFPNCSVLWPTKPTDQEPLPFAVTVSTRIGSLCPLTAPARASPRRCTSRRSWHPHRSGHRIILENHPEIATNPDGRGLH
jgi:hypothetical protein